MDYNNKIAIVTGGTGGLGKVVTAKFADKGMKIYLPVRSIETFNKEFDNSTSSETFSLRKIYAFNCDAQNESEVNEFIDNVYKLEGRIDVLVNCIGGYHPKKNIVDMETELINKMMDLNFKTAFYFTRQCLKYMIEKNYGRIISIGAMPALQPSPGKFAYSISKSNVVNLMETASKECKNYNITANSIVPLIIDTEANRKSMPDADFTKWTKPEDIAGTILFLISESAKTISGNAIKV